MEQLQIGCSSLAPESRAAREALGSLEEHSGQSLEYLAPNRFETDSRPGRRRTLLQDSCV